MNISVFEFYEYIKNIDRYFDKNIDRYFDKNIDHVKIIQNS